MYMENNIQNKEHCCQRCMDRFMLLYYVLTFHHSLQYPRGLVVLTLLPKRMLTVLFCNIKGKFESVFELGQQLIVFKEATQKDLRLRPSLDQRNFAGKMKETKMEERETRNVFGTKENIEPFPLEYCSVFTISQETIPPLQPLFCFSFAEAQGSCASNSLDVED